MNAFFSALYRGFICASAALLISLVVGMSFVQSTATVPSGHHAPVVAANIVKA